MSMVLWKQGMAVVLVMISFVCSGHLHYHDRSLFLLIALNLWWVLVILLAVVAPIVSDLDSIEPRVSFSGCRRGKAPDLGGFPVCVGVGL
jgi:hypothetical protein